MIRLISSRPSLVVVVAHLEVSPLDSLISQSILPLNRYDKGLIFFFFLLGGSSRGRRQRRGEDVVHPLKVSLEDLYLGTTKKLSLSRNTLCSKCNGLVS